MASWDDLYLLTCPVCGIQYGIPKHFRDARYEGKNQSSEGQSWYCPNGHSLSYRETELDRIRQERDRLKQQNARLDEERLAAERREAAAERREAAAKRETARLQKRAGAGVCPCCNRTFTQLARHMQNKHPDTPFVPPVKKIAPVRPARKEAT